MPLLTKKKIVKGPSGPTSSSQPNNDTDRDKTPLLTKENISQILMDDVKVNNSTSCSQPDPINQIDQTPTISGSSHNTKNHILTPTNRNLVKTKSNLSLNMHLSFENSQKDSEASSDISFRMNEPKIKEAYFQFVKSLSQSSNNSKEPEFTSTPLTPIFNEDISFSETSLQKTDESNLSMSSIHPSFENRQKESDATSDISFRMNEPKIKEAYFDFVKSLSQSSNKQSDDVTCSPTTQILDTNEDISFLETSLQETYTGIKDNRKLKKRGNNKVLINNKLFNNQGGKRFSLRIANLMAQKSSSQKTPCGSQTKTLSTDSVVPLSQKHKKTTAVNRKGKLTVKKKASLKRKNTMKVVADHDSSNKKLTLEKRIKLLQESRNVGLYVLCDICDKARYLPHIKDPLDLPDKWYCHMNPDEKHNECSHPEEIDNKDKDYLISNLYNAGSIIWARMDNKDTHPWWPAMVEDDLEEEAYFWLDGKSDIPTWYHVTFFDSTKVIKAWIKPSRIKPFKINRNNPQFWNSGDKYKSRIHAAFKQACDAIELPLLDRLRKYSFINRYNKPLRKRHIKQDSENKVQKKRIMQSNPILIGHNVGFSEEKSLSLFSINSVASSCTIDVNCKDTEMSDSFGPRNNENQDISDILNNINWVGHQDLSFNLLD